MKNISLYIDLVFCLVVLPAMAITFPVERWYHNFQWYVLTAGAWLYAVYFVNRVVTVPYLFARGWRGAVGGALVVLSLLGTWLLGSVTLYTPKPSMFDYGFHRVLPSVLQYQQALWSLFMIVEAFSFAVGLLTQANIQRARRRAVEAERDHAEIELYKAQIKPHFMFNTLNSLYGLFLTHNDKALESLEKFISMTRYMHVTSGCAAVPLAEEVDYIRQYVDLQSLRLNAMTTVRVVTDVADPAILVPPMLLVTFVENCFKHGTSPDEPSTMRVTLVEKGGVLDFATENRVFPRESGGDGTGLANCRERLRRLYPGAHKLEITNDGTTFGVRLSVDLNNSISRF